MLVNPLILQSGKLKFEALKGLAGDHIPSRGQSYSFNIKNIIEIINKVATVYIGRTAEPENIILPK